MGKPIEELTIEEMREIKRGFNDFDLHLFELMSLGGLTSMAIMEGNMNMGGNDIERIEQERCTQQLVYYETPVKKYNRD